MWFPIFLHLQSKIMFIYWKRQLQSANSLQSTRLLVEIQYTDPQLGTAAKYQFIISCLIIKKKLNKKIILFLVELPTRSVTKPENGKNIFFSQGHSTLFSSMGHSFHPDRTLEINFRTRPNQLILYLCLSRSKVKWQPLKTPPANSRT